MYSKNKKDNRNKGFQDGPLEDNDTYNYSQVEDIAGVDYKKALILTGAFLGMNVLLKSFAISYIGLAAYILLPILIWGYFKKYFTAVQDFQTAKMINWTMLAYGLFFFTCIFASLVPWEDMYTESMWEVGFSVIIYIFDSSYQPALKSTKFLQNLIGFASFCMIISFVGIFAAAVRIMIANKHHFLPLKRIAFSSMFLIPLGMIVYLGEWVTNDVDTGYIFNSILMLPYIFLFHHFYRAETEDVTS